MKHQPQVSPAATIADILLFLVFAALLAIGCVVLAWYAPAMLIAALIFVLLVIATLHTGTKPKAP